MWAGSRLEFLKPLRVGAEVTRVSRIEDVVLKEGRSGPLAFVTVRHELSDRDEIEAVRADIKALPARQRAALLLSADGERSNAEIAKMLGASEKAVESMLVRARRTLRAKLAAREEA